MTDLASVPRRDMSSPAPPAAGTLRDRLRRWRNRMIGNPAFRATARRLPVLGRMTRASANGLFAITAGFANAQILLACVELDLFVRLAGEPRTTDDLAMAVDLNPDAADRLLRAAEGLDLVCRTSQGRWTLADHGAVIAASPGIAAMVRHHAMVYRDLSDPVGLLRNPPDQTETSRFWSYVDGEPGARDAADYSELMRLSQDMVITEVLDAYPMAGHRRLIDIGGGDGAFITAVGTRWKSLALDLFDLPAVADTARARLEAGVLGPRLTIHGGSFFDDPIPSEPDCYALIRVLYDHDDDAALRLLTNIRRAMRPGDTLIIGEPMAGPSPGGKLVAAYFTFYLLAMRSGRCRDHQAIFDLLGAAGFTQMRAHRTTMPVVAGLVSARV